MTEALEKAQIDAALEDRTAALRAKLREKELAREKRQEEARALREAEELELKLANEEAIEAAEVQYGEIGREIAAVETPEGVIIVRRPHPAHYRAFQDAKDASTTTVLKMVRPSVVHPDREVFDKLIGKFPGALPVLATQCSRLAGFKFEEVAGK